MNVSRLIVHVNKDACLYFLLFFPLIFQNFPTHLTVITFITTLYNLSVTLSSCSRVQHADHIQNSAHLKLRHIKPLHTLFHISCVFFFFYYYFVEFNNVKFA